MYTLLHTKGFDELYQLGHFLELISSVCSPSTTKPVPSTFGTASCSFRQADSTFFQSSGDNLRPYQLPIHLPADAGQHGLHPFVLFMGYGHAKVDS